MSQLLLVEDDAGIAEPLARALRRDGHEVKVTGSGRDSLQLVAAGRTDLVILDLGLPDLDGLEVLRRLRTVDAGLAVLVLTARVEEVDVVAGLDTGANDYVAKPFRLAELQARVRALLRRPESPPTPVLEVRGVRVDVGARRAWRDAEELTLTTKEFDLLALLLSEAGTVVTRDRIMADVWDEHWYGKTKTLDMHLSWLRRKLGDDPSSPRYITTVRGVGLRFER